MWIYRATAISVQRLEISVEVSGRNEITIQISTNHILEFVALQTPTCIGIKLVKHFLFCSERLSSWLASEILQKLTKLMWIYRATAISVQRLEITADWTDEMKSQFKYRRIKSSNS